MKQQLHAPVRAFPEAARQLHSSDAISSPDDTPATGSRRNRIFKVTGSADITTTPAGETGMPEDRQSLGKADLKAAA